jgi:predicted phosphodiesterase
MKDWHDRAKELKFNKNLSWTELFAQLSKEYPNNNLKKEAIRSYIRKSQEYQANQVENKKTVKEELLQRLKTNRTIDELCNLIGQSKRIILAYLEDLKEEGYLVCNNGDVWWLQQKPKADYIEHKHDYQGEKSITIGVVSDTHLCSKHQQLTYLNNFYDICQSRGIDTIFHCGDISDGYYKNRPEHIYDIFKIGADEQADYIAKVYPRREGITTKFITGNHDHTHMRNGGVDIGRMIANRRNDMKYLGSSYAKYWITPKCDMDLFHPLDGSAYALSYSIQKYIDSLQGGDKPRILLVGHHHKGFYLAGYRNVHTFEVPSMQAQTTFERGKKINSWVGGWIIKFIIADDGEVREILPIFKQYYKMIKDDYDV